MNYINYRLSPNTPIKRWLVAGPFEEEKSFDLISMNHSGDLNRWLTEGFSVFENPSRREFIESEKILKKENIQLHEIIPGKSLTYNSYTKSWNYYFPWKNKKVEQSGFWQQPTHLKSWAMSHIHSDESVKRKFKLYTCGSVNLWVNGKKVLEFSPYTRNEEKNIEFEVMLQDGDNDFLVLYEDLAERDTLFYFRLDYLGEDELEIKLPIGEVQSNDIHQLENALNNSCFSSDLVKGDDLVLFIENPLERSVQIDYRYRTDWWGSKKDFNSLIPSGAKEVSLGKVKELGMGNFLFNISLKLEPIVMQKDIFIQLHPDVILPHNLKGNYEARKNIALSFIAEHGVEDLHKAYALAKTGGDLNVIESIVRATLHEINARFDCSDFYLIQLFRFWQDFHETDLFDDQFWQDCKQAILDYRYWFDEPGNDVMWFFSENHALLFHTCEYLAGQLFPTETFTNANILGVEHVERAEKRLTEWFKKFTREGLAEWNSSAYIPINMMGFLQIFDHVENPFLKREAKKALDTTFRLMALNSFRGYLSCSHGRIYEKELKGNYCNATTSLLWIAYGTGNLNNSTFATTSLSVSKYVPPDYESFIKVNPNENIIFKHRQGPRGFVDLYTYKNHYGLLSSAIDYRTGTNGYSEHVIHSTLSPEAIVWINHPGEETELGTGRPSFWAGNGTLPKVEQYRDFALIQYKIDLEKEIDYTHAYFPIKAFDQVEVTSNWCFGKIGDSYIALYARNGMGLQTTGQNKNRELTSKGRENIWIIRNSNIRQFGSFKEFMQKMGNIEIYEANNQFTVHDPIYGVIKSSWKSPLIVSGNIQSKADYPVEGILKKTTYD